MPNPSITITGYVSKKPEMRSTPKGLAVLSFSIPVKVWSKNEREGYKPAYSGTGFECTAWFNIVMFGESAEQAEWLDKGAFVQCEIKPNGQVANGNMGPKTFNGRTSYDWLASSVSLADKETSTEQEPPDFVEENQIPF
jgi:hypothetical protein